MTLNPKLPNVKSPSPSDPKNKQKSSNGSDKIQNPTNPKKDDKQKNTKSDGKPAILKTEDQLTPNFAKISVNQTENTENHSPKTQSLLNDLLGPSQDLNSSLFSAPTTPSKSTTSIDNNNQDLTTSQSTTQNSQDSTVSASPNDNYSSSLSKILNEKNLVEMISSPPSSKAQNMEQQIEDEKKKFKNNFLFLEDDFIKEINDPQEITKPELPTFELFQKKKSVHKMDNLHEKQQKQSISALSATLPTTTMLSNNNNFESSESTFSSKIALTMNNNFVEETKILTLDDDDYANNSDDPSDDENDKNANTLQLEPYDRIYYDTFVEFVNQEHFESLQEQEESQPLSPTSSKPGASPFKDSGIAESQWKSDDLSRSPPVNISSSFSFFTYQKGKNKPFNNSKNAAKMEKTFIQRFSFLFFGFFF